MAKQVYKNRAEFEKATGLKKHKQKFIANPRFRDPAHHIMLRNKTQICVHGTIVDEYGIEQPHAWVEHGGLCYDIFYGVTFRQDEYYKVFKVGSVKKYTAAQLRKILDVERTYGPFKYS